MKLYTARYGEDYSEPIFAQSIDEAVDELLTLCDPNQVIELVGEPDRNGIFEHAYLSTETGELIISDNS